MLIFGGIGSLRGAVIGAVAFTLLKELFQSEALLGSLASHWQLTLGLTIIAFVAALPRGLIGLGARLRAAPWLRPARPCCRRSASARRFRGLAAVDGVSIDLRVGEIHAVIGTNGAGKSTLVNMLSGELAPSAGSVRFAGHDVTRWSQPRRARAGLGRSYQRTTIFREFSVLENCRLAAQASEPRPWLRLGARRRRRARHRDGSARAGCGRARPRSRRERPRRSATAPSASSRSRCAWRPRRAPSSSTSRSPAWAPRRPGGCSTCWLR